MDGFREDPATRTVLGVERSVNGRVWRERLDARGALWAEAISQRHGLPDIIARVLAARGVDPDQAEGFLEPRLKALMPDPSRLTDMDLAAERIADAIMAGERIAIFADYDVDGATSAALMVRFLRNFGQDPQVYIPDRLTEGYGPNVGAMRALANGGAQLIVTLDCGTTSIEPLAEAVSLGVDVVVLDHHQTGEELPPARALVNPNRQDDLSGEGHLAAVGVTFLTLVAVNRELRRRGTYSGHQKEPDLLALLDLVALGTVADVVPLLGLNRAYVRQGLSVLAQRGNIGLTALSAIARMSGPPSPYHLGFLLGPRINAGGRIGEPGLGVSLLTATDPALAERIAVQLDQLNSERQAMEAEMLEAADARAAVEVAQSDPAVVVAHGDDWHMGVVGVVASRLKEKYRRPACAIAFNADGVGTGSGRSVSGVDLGRVVRRAVEEGIAIKGGGHVMAAGLSLRRERLNDLKAFFETELAADVRSARAVDALSIDGPLTAAGANADLVSLIERAGPYGSGHPQPIFALPAHRVAYAEPVGKGHVRCTLAAGDGSKLKGIAFRALGEPLGDLLLSARGRAVHLAGTLGLDYWQGQPRVQIRLIDGADPVAGR
ncbi:MAG: single-stranded-DNA-specific exonuclease RecJ [Hyphomicrobiales bacterium]|nr:MAG: single-stranded-DNA-specific exonuclease RecJ [Hyphomicrobiales bacterium]